MKKDCSFKKYHVWKKLIFWQIIVNFADFQRNNSIFMKKKKLKISSTKKIYILTSKHEKSQISLLIIFYKQCFRVSAYGLCTGGKIKIISLLTYFKISPMKFAIRRKKMNAPNYFWALSSRVHRSMFIGEICFDTT